MTIIAGLSWLSTASPAGNIAGAAILGAVFFLRTHVWTLPPVVLLLALRRARGWSERALVGAVMIGPPLIFFLWDARHVKLLASLPLVGELVRPLGYVPFILLDERPYRTAYQLCSCAAGASYEFLPSRPRSSSPARRGGSARHAGALLPNRRVNLLAVSSCTCCLPVRRLPDQLQ